MQEHHAQYIGGQIVPLGNPEIPEGSDIVFKVLNSFTESCVGNVESMSDSHREYILGELKKAKEYARRPDAVWYNEDEMEKILEEPV